jgi:hypothetical protein
LWGINSIVLIQSGLPWGLADATDDFSGTNEISNSTQGRGEQWDFFGNPNDFIPVHGWTGRKDFLTTHGLELLAEVGNRIHFQHWNGGPDVIDQATHILNRSCGIAATSYGDLKVYNWLYIQELNGARRHGHLSGITRPIVGGQTAQGFSP